ncbi:transferrin [Solenopsis invicta]|uniref:transferrin n=1 Tax=Solenopsis invicta TaxID=13686 RepID=UPI00193DB1DC|nr:transferrin [Solenopsis invicta]
MLRNRSIAPVRIKRSLDIVSRSAMRNLVWIILFVAAARAEYKFCAPYEVVDESSCYAVQRGDNSEVSCFRVADSAECAIRLAQGEADFGVFNAEELLLTYQFYQSEMQPILQLRHKDRQQDESEFQTVAVIPTSLDLKAVSPEERIKNLKNGGFCHPGFSKSQWWNDYILKRFENTVNPPQCRDDVTVIENEIRNLRNFFGKACRPGEWTADVALDKELKRKYSELCALCDDRENCKYNDDMQHHGHVGALQCLTRGNGKVAYVALKYVQDILKRNESYQFLCPGGSVLPLSTPNPCTWLKQPWSVVVARNEVADSLKKELLSWLRSPGKEDWKNALSAIIQVDSRAYEMDKTTIGTYLSTNGRITEIDSIETCGKHIRWCTIGDLETNKCKWVAKAAKALGVAPSISCVNSTSTFQCFREIEENRADIITIDSNYGYIARTFHGLSTMLYSETELDKNSVIVAVMREPADENYPVKSFFDLKNKRACFPEYSGIAWLSFVMAARTNGVISSKKCDYPSIVSRLLSGACTPGIEDSDHSPTGMPSDISSTLCSACGNQIGFAPFCAGDKTNRYYGDRGAIRCIKEEAGDIAFIEIGNVHNDKHFEPSEYRVLCKNGSLAQHVGIEVDEFCALSVTIDSEVVGRKQDVSLISRTDTILALKKMEDWLGYRVNARRPIHIYGPFNGTLDLLFKDSSSGLLPTSTTKKSVLAYKELFSHVEKCNNNGSFVAVNFVFVALVALYHLLSSHVH